MKEYPILFSSPMVLALLDGRKTQARRVMRELTDDEVLNVGEKWSIRSDGFGVALGARYEQDQWTPGFLYRKCPYGVSGDHLWVRETWGVGTRPDPGQGWVDGIEYRADEADTQDERDLLPLYPVEPPVGIDLDTYKGRWRPSIHMPRWASRLTLEVVSVRVERVQEISASNAKAEGCDPYIYGEGLVKPPRYGDEYQYRPDYRMGFEILWDRINGKKPGRSWADNPWVWVLEFKVVTK